MAAATAISRRWGLIMLATFVVLSYMMTMGGGNRRSSRNEAGNVRYREETTQETTPEVSPANNATSPATHTRQQNRARRQLPFGQVQEPEEEGALMSCLLRVR